MFRLLYKFFFYKVFKWTTVGYFPPELKKFICIVAPHTSNWDFFVGLAARSILKLHHVKYLGKSQLFRWPYGIIFRKTGGYPVYRDKHNNLVDQVVDIFNSKDEFAIALAPEGTRKKVNQLKTGFYHIAVKAGIPIMIVGFDYARKLVVIREPFYPSGDIEKDMPIIMDFFKGIKGKRPEYGVS